MESQKITPLKSAASRRSYDDACGTAHALDLVGERWALLVIRELMLGPKRFGDLRRDLPGISANVLTQRLEGLEDIGVLVRRRLPPPVSAQVYELTPWGYEAEPILQVMGRWAARSPSHNPSLPLSAVSLLLSFRTMCDPARAAGLDMRVALDIGGESFFVRVRHGAVEAERGNARDADFTLSGPAPAITGAVYGGVPLEALEAQGALKLEGDRSAAEKFVTLFPLPPKVGAE